MTTRDAFKAGFMQFCGENGFTGPQAADLTQKAALLLEKKAFGLESLGDIPNAVGTVALGAPILAGAGLGYLAHKATKNEVDPEDVRKHELIQELRTYARRAREAQKQRTYR